jgi:non-ribosomal peptide synthetase component F
LLPELPLQYADYAAWQRQWLQGEILENQIKFWRQQLQGAPPVLKLPADRERPQVQSFRGGHEEFAMAKDLADALNTLGRQEGVTLFMTMLAAFNAMLARDTGEDQIVIGTDVANRPTLECERMIGFFINLLPLRTDLSGNPSFRDLLARVRETTLASYTHQEMPFDKLVEELRPERSLSHNPLVQVLFVMQNTPRASREFCGLKLSRFEMPIAQSKFDLAVFANENESGIYFHWLYSADLFERATVTRMSGHFENLLRSAIANPDARLSQLEMLSPEEKERQAAEKEGRKQTQRKKLMSVDLKSVSLGKGAGE